MILIPAIDLIGGQAVRLRQGEFHQKKVYPLHPVDYAIKWVNQGAKMLHLVDLEATLEGRPVNHRTIENIRASVSVPLEVGGGIRSKETFQRWLEIGVDRIVIGTKALEEDFIKDLAKEYPDRLVVSLDVRDSFVQTEGWISGTKINYLDLAKRLTDLGVKHFIYTDISKDGTLEGPNWAGLEALLEATPATVILSGGVSHLDHVRRLAGIKRPNLYGAIIGKALYEGKIELGKAVYLLGELHAQTA
jgi:phosphoribosylformimino-5-aminoimidazole carboxamide ribotide isomerase